MIDNIKVKIAKHLANTISYIISWLGLKLFDEVYIHADENDKVQGLLFTNDPRHIMLLKDHIVPISELITDMGEKISVLEEKVVEAGGIIDYGKTDRNKETKTV